MCLLLEGGERTVLQATFSPDAREREFVAVAPDKADQQAILGQDLVIEADRP